MFGIHHYGAFLTAIVIFQLIPGAGTITILNTTAKNGLRAGFSAVTGTLLGDLIYMVAATLGLAAIMQAHPNVFRTLQWGGAAYLVWMGVQLFFAKPFNGDAQIERVSQHIYFRRALLVGLTNPKVILFFVAFFPLFIQPDSSATTLVIMMAHVTVISLLYQSGLVVIGNAAAKRLNALPSIRKLATRTAGISLVAFGLRLALDDH